MASVHLDRWQYHKDSYQARDNRVQTIDKVARGDWHMVWPDSKAERQLPRIPNYVDLAVRHRARLVAETMPTISVKPESVKAEAKIRAEKRERIISGWWDRNHISGFRMQQWGTDLMLTGLAATRVLPDFSQPDPAKRFPLYHRLDPRTVYPSPVFAEGPFIDDAVVGQEMTVTQVQTQYDCDLGAMMSQAKKLGETTADRVNVFSFYDRERVMIVAQPISTKKKGMFEVCVDEAHGLGKCPIVIGVRPSHDGAYRGDFDSMLGMLNVGNIMMNLHLDSAARKVYAVMIHDEALENPEDEGPGAILSVKDNTGRVGDHVDYLQHPAAAYDNYQVMRTLDSAIRTAALLPPSVTGDPNESVVSAAGVAATQSMPNAEVVSLQRDSLAPMLQAANELAMRCEEMHSDVDKTITGVQRGAPFAEKYKPSKDIAGDYNNEVMYGMGSGLDKVNTSVMVKQDLGAGLISRQEARELSPFVPDPIRTERLVRTEMLTDAAYAGILAATQLPPGTPGAIDLPTLAALWEDLEKDDIPLRDALKLHAERMALVKPPASPSDQMNPMRPGMAGQQGAQETPTMQGPPLEQLLAG